MKIFIFAILIHFCFLFQGIANSNPDSVFYKANNNYALGDFTKAIELYEIILLDGLESGELYYNLGNAYYKNQNYPKSILNYERALLYDPRDEDILHNLAKSRMHIIDKIDEIPEFVIKSWINNLIILFTSNVWAILSMITFFLGLLLFLMYFLSFKLMLKRIGFYAGIIALIFSFTFLYLSFKSKSLLKNSSGGIIMTSTVTVKASPRDTGTDLFIIHEGTKVLIIDSLDTWYEIRLSDGKQGWMQQKDVEAI